MIWTIIAIVCVGIFLLSLFLNIQRIKADRAIQPRPRREYVINYLLDTQNAKEFFDYYQHDLYENDDYNDSAKELREYHDHEKVWKYEPFELPFKINGNEVYSELDGEWVKVGRLKKNADLEGDLTLYFYPNIYKWVTEESISKESGEHYFGIECVKPEKM